MPVLNCPMWPTPFPTYQDCKWPLDTHPLHWPFHPTSVHYLVEDNNNRTCLTLFDPNGDTGSGYPFEFYDCNIRQKQAQSCGLMFIDLPDGCCYGDKNTWNTFPVSGQK